MLISPAAFSRSSSSSASIRAISWRCSPPLRAGDLVPGWRRRRDLRCGGGRLGRRLVGRHPGQVGAGRLGQGFVQPAILVRCRPGRFAGRLDVLGHVRLDAGQRIVGVRVDGFRPGVGGGRNLHRPGILVVAGQVPDQVLVDDDHADRVFRLRGKFLRCRRDLVAATGQRPFAGIGDRRVAARTQGADPVLEIGRRAHGLACRDVVAHAMQFVDALLQELVDARRHVDSTVVDADEQRLELVAQVPHGGNARHARTALQRVQVTLQLLEVLARPALAAPGGERPVGRLEELGGFL